MSITNIKYLTDVYNGPSSQGGNSGRLLIKKAHSFYNPEKQADWHAKNNGPQSFFKPAELQPYSALTPVTKQISSTDNNKKLFITFGTASRSINESSSLLGTISERSCTMSDLRIQEANHKQIPINSRKSSIEEEMRPIKLIDT